jgi:hypothetical protein
MDASKPQSSMTVPSAVPVLMPNSTGLRRSSGSTPHIVGTFVLEDARGQLFLLFKHHGLSAWAGRIAWRGGVDMLVPLDRPHALVLDESGYTEAH